eukprot:m.79975 g.79975  ORF g.79975 m.79975 type:complete len:63 (-) comp8616_c9_seq1:3556-3744(-)
MILLTSSTNIIICLLMKGRTVSNITDEQTIQTAAHNFIQSLCASPACTSQPVLGMTVAFQKQ